MNKKVVCPKLNLDAHVLNAPYTVEGIDYSDHRSFWHFKYPAVMMTDTIEKLDFNRMAEIVRGVYRAVTAP